MIHLTFVHGLYSLAKLCSLALIFITPDLEVFCVNSLTIVITSAFGLINLFHAELFQCAKALKPNTMQNNCNALGKIKPFKLSLAYV